MSPERKLAELVAHPWTEYRHGDETYYGAKCQLEYAMRVNQLAALCDLHRRTPLTKEILKTNGFSEHYDAEIGKYPFYILGDSHIFTCEDETRFEFIASDGKKSASATIYTVAELESILDIFGVDVDIKLPKPKPEEAQIVNCTS